MTGRSEGVSEWDAGMSTARGRVHMRASSRLKPGYSHTLLTLSLLTLHFLSTPISFSQLLSLLCVTVGHHVIFHLITMIRNSTRCIWFVSPIIPLPAPTILRTFSNLGAHIARTRTRTGPPVHYGYRRWHARIPLAYARASACHRVSLLMRMPMSNTHSMRKPGEFGGVFNPWNFFNLFLQFSKNSLLLTIYWRKKLPITYL